MQESSDAAITAGTLARPRRKGKAGGRKAYGRTAKVGALTSVLRQGGNELIGIPHSMIMARLLSPYDFGVAAASGFFILLASRVTQFGFAGALVRVKELRPEHASSVYLVNQAIGIVTFATLFACAPLVGQFLRSADAGRLLPVAALVFLITPLSVVPGALFQRRMQFRYLMLTDWIDTAIGAVATIVLALNGFGFWSIVYGPVIAMVVRIPLQLYLSEWRPSFRFSRAAMRELLSFGLGLHAKRVLEYASNNLDNLVVGRVLGITPLGIYNKAFTTMNKVVFRLELGQAPFRIFSVIHEDAERFRRAYSRLILSITLLGYPALVGLIVAAEPLIVVLYGERWTPAVLPFQILCFGGMLKLLNAYASQANEAAGNLWRQVRRQAMGPVLVAAGAAVGATYGGLAGAALGVLAAWAVVTMALQALVRQATGLSWMAMLRLQVPGATCALLLAGVLLCLDAAVRALLAAPPAWLLLLVQIAGGSVFYLGFVLFSPSVAVRELVHETLTDLLPQRVKDLGWHLKLPAFRVSVDPS